MSKHTQQAMIDVFMALLKEKSFDKITVKEIIEGAEVNRNTFYYHFLDINDLVDALLRMQTAMDAWRIGVKRWRMILVFALLVALAGGMLFLRPYEGRTAIVMLMGVNLIIDGVLNLFVVQNTVSILRR